MDDGNCLVNYTVTGWGDSNNNHGSLNITVTDDCKVVVSDVLLKYDANPKLPDIDPTGTYERHNGAKDKKISSLLSSLRMLLSGAVEREGWAYQEYEEQFHIDVTKAWVEMDYWDNNSKVYNGHDQWLNLWWRSGTGWYKIAHGLWYSLGGPSVVWIMGYGEYDNDSWPIPYELWHKLWVEFDGYPGGSYSWSCWFQGEKPPLWHTHCSGGIRSPT